MTQYNTKSFKKSAVHRWLGFGLSLLIVACGSNENKTAQSDLELSKPGPAKTAPQPDQPGSGNAAIVKLDGAYSTAGWSCFKDGYSFSNGVYNTISSDLAASKYAVRFSGNSMVWVDFLNLAFSGSLESADCVSTQTSTIEYLNSSQFKVVETKTDCSSSCSSDFCSQSKGLASNFDGAVLSYSNTAGSLKVGMFEESGSCKTDAGAEDGLIGIDLKK